MIEKEFIRASQIFSEISVSVPLMLMTLDRIRTLETRANGVPTLAALNKELLKKLMAIQSIDDHAAIAQAYEAYFECSFALEMNDRGFSLDRTPGTGIKGEKRSDFVYKHRDGSIFFELKALEIADPMNRHSEMAEEAFENAVELESRSQTAGVHVGNAQSISGPIPGLSVSQRVDAITNKIQGAIKLGQIYYGPTVLVVDLGRHPVVSHGPSNLLPIFFNNGFPCKSCVSGELWHIGFGQPGERMFCLPECDGFTNLDGHLKSEGIFRRYPGLVAIMFHLPRWNKPSEILTLWNESFDHPKLNLACTIPEHELSAFLHAASDGLNNSRNELGWVFTISP